MPLNTELLIKKMVFLRRGQGKLLLPKSGTANFMPHFNKFLAIEADPAKCPKGALNMSLFDLSFDRQFQGIIAILPQLSYKNIDLEFKDKLKGYDKNTNLYIFYIDKCLQHLDSFGEMILQTSADFLKSCPVLNKKLFALGTITDVIDAGRAGQIIWRFVKDDHSKRTLVNGEWKKFTSMNGQLMFLNREYTVPFRDLFSIKVGAISGCDEAFLSPDGNVSFISAQTPQSGATKKMFFNVQTEHLLPYKERLLKRKVKKFTEDNWWMWGRSHHISQEKRVYVPVKTKQKTPFFNHSCLHYDGTLLGVFFKDTVTAAPEKVAAMLNEVDWGELGFRVGGRFIFSQNALESVLLPKEFTSLTSSSSRTEDQRCKSPSSGGRVRTV